MLAIAAVAAGTLGANEAVEVEDELVLCANGHPNPLGTSFCLVRNCDCPVDASGARRAPTVHQQSAVGKSGPWTADEVLLLRHAASGPGAWKRTAEQLGTHRNPNSVRLKYKKLQPTPAVAVRAAGGEQESPAGRASSADSASYSTSIIDGSTAQSTIAAMPVQRHPPSCACLAPPPRVPHAHRQRCSALAALHPPCT